MNQINQLTVMDSRGADLKSELRHDQAVYEDDIAQSDSNLDYEGITESQMLAQEGEDVSGLMDMEGTGEDGEEDEDVIDVDNPEDLAKKGLRRIQIEGDDQEYLLDGEGNIYNLQGEFVGTTGDDAEEEMEVEQDEDQQ